MGFFPKKGRSTTNQYKMTRFLYKKYQESAGEGGGKNVRRQKAP
jgi:hypothetical protein